MILFRLFVQRVILSLFTPLNELNLKLEFAIPIMNETQTESLFRFDSIKIELKLSLSEFGFEQIQNQPHRIQFELSSRAAGELLELALVFNQKLKDTVSFHVSIKEWNSFFLSRSRILHFFWPSAFSSVIRSHFSVHSISSTLTRSSSSVPVHYIQYSSTSSVAVTCHLRLQQLKHLCLSSIRIRRRRDEDISGLLFVF